MNMPAATRHQAIAAGECLLHEPAGTYPYSVMSTCEVKKGICRRENSQLLACGMMGAVLYPGSACRAAIACTG